MAILLNFYLFLVLGLLLILGALFFLYFSYKEREFIGRWSFVKMIGALLVGSFLLFTTLPSLKSVVTKDYEVVSGECILEMYSSGKSVNTTVNFVNTDEQFSFDDIPSVDAIGENYPYYCEVTVTKDYEWTISYKVFDLVTKKLLN